METCGDVQAIFLRAGSFISGQGLLRNHVRTSNPTSLLKSIKWHVGGGPKLQFQRTTSTASRPGKKLPRSRGVINFNSPSRFMFVERINAYHSLTRSILVEISRESTRPSVSRDCSHPSLLISTGYFTLGPPRFAYPLATDFTHAA